MIDTRIVACMAVLLTACASASEPTPAPAPSSQGHFRVTSVSASEPAPPRDSLAARMLAVHNDARDEAGLARLRWNDDLAKGAMTWAQTISRDGNMRHSPRDSRENVGENLWMGTADFFTLEHMIEVMVEEKRDFRPGTFPEVSRTGRWEDVAHYTQIIWPTTEEVGCALSTANGRDALVCRYWPTGNIIGRPVG
jgi:hypothetical protein